MIFILILFAAFYFSSAGVFASEEVLPDISEIYDVNDLSSNLPNDVASKMEDDFSKDGFTLENIFGEMIEAITENILSPFKTFLSVISVMLISSAASGNGRRIKYQEQIVNASIAVILIAPIMPLIKNTVSILKSVTVFSYAFTPVFAAIVSAKGSTVTAASSSVLMVIFSDAIGYAASFFIAPICTFEISLGLCSSVGDEVSLLPFSELISKTVKTLLKFLSVIFSAFLSIKTLISKPADSVSDKAVKFIIGNSVPIIGNSVGEAFTVIKSSFSLLASTVGIYGIAAVGLIMLPAVAELIIRRFFLYIGIFTADALGLRGAASLQRCIDGALSVLTAASVLVFTVFSLSVIIVSAV